jgi:nicotinate-nucleotide pyrophosphorylase
MNVSSEILNAFKIVDKSIANSNKAVEERNKLVTDHFQEYINDEDAKPEKREKVKQALLLANQVNEKTEAIVSELKKYKQLIIEASGGVDEQGNIRQIENLDGGTRVMIEEGNGPKVVNFPENF